MEKASVEGTGAGCHLEKIADGGDHVVVMEIPVVIVRRCRSLPKLPPAGIASDSGETAGDSTLAMERLTGGEPRQVPVPV